ncbi:hypothetical protein [Halorubrum tebenquichense]|uniref:hypothetical protein n=1 Tax=Halorubrum tebenquichense TaxID=119434 RepID=UPI000677D70E|nr:hypothetical protein [Halorubrum tebenquichense]
MTVLSVKTLELYNLEDSDRKGTTQYERIAIDQEETLENWLHRNPELLLDEQVLLIGRQVRLNTGVADLVGLDRWGNVLVVEIKKGLSGSGSASEGSIISQPLEYSEPLSSFNYDDLDDLYQEYQERIERSEWDVGEIPGSGGNLLTDFKSVFGDGIEEHQFNSTQRMVVVAEAVTRRTEQNVRYLLEQGLNFQCLEIQVFRSPDTETESTTLATQTVVDYPLGRVRPKDQPSPTYPALVNEIVERAYPNFQSVTNAASISELFPEGIDHREPRLVSQNDDHPTSIKYRLAPKPDDRTVVIAIDAQGNSVAGVSELQSMQAEFAVEGLDVTGNQTYRVVTQKWELEDAETLGEELLDEIAEQYAALIQLGHEAFITA